MTDAPRQPSASQLFVGPHDPASRRTLVTPEGVDLSLGLASGGQRIAAFVADQLIMIGVLIGFSLIALALAAGAGSAQSVTGLEVIGAIWLVGAFLIRNGYFIFFEAGSRAATWGKRLMGLRVVARNGERLTVESVIARNLMREVEIFLPLSLILYAAFSPDEENGLLVWAAAAWVLIFLLFPLFNKDRLRIGDLLAGTWVVLIPKRTLAFDLSVEREGATAITFTPEQLDAYGVFELQTLEQVLRDGHGDAMRLVAGTIRTRIDYWGPGEDWEFLSGYYSAARRRMERGLLFGKRRANKYES